MELLTGFEARWPNTAQREQFTEHLAMRLRTARLLTGSVGKNSPENTRPPQICGWFGCSATAHRSPWASRWAVPTKTPRQAARITENGVGVTELETRRLAFSVVSTNYRSVSYPRRTRHFVSRCNAARSRFHQHCPEMKLVEPIHSGLRRHEWRTRYLRKSWRRNWLTQLALNPDAPP